MLQEAQLEDEVELQAEPGRILISKTAKPRAGWAEAARRMRDRGEDRLLESAAPNSILERGVEVAVEHTALTRGDVYLIASIPPEAAKYERRDLAWSSLRMN